MTGPEQDRVGIVGVDGSPDSKELVRFVHHALHPSWRWVVVHVVDLAAPAHADVLDTLTAATTEFLDKVVHHLPGATAVIERSPDVAEGLRSVARAHGASLLVIGAGDRGPLASALLGSVSTALMDEAPCPVMTVRPPAPFPGRSPADD